MALLCTRVQHPDVDDYKKPCRVMRYLRGTATMPLTLEANGTNIIKWWVDASLICRPSRSQKSHWWGDEPGKGGYLRHSSKHKLNTKSSPEAKLVDVNDVMPQVLWTRYFLEAQRFTVSDSVVYQDSAILLEKNGRASSGKRTHTLISDTFLEPTGWPHRKSPSSTTQPNKCSPTFSPSRCRVLSSRLFATSS